jgi:putative transposase
VPRPLRVEVAGGIYHVVARGNERREIFRDNDDREDYLRRLAASSARFRFRVLAYCLMDNHVHLALERGPTALSKVMHALHSAYAQRFNRRHGRVGHLFQGRYKAYLVQEERYLLTLIRYIHLNPVAAGLVDRPESFRWVTDRCYRYGEGPRWLATDVLLTRLDSNVGHARAVYARLMAEGAGQSWEDLAAYHDAIKGERAFAHRTLAALGEGHRVASVDWSPEKVAALVANAEGVPLARFRSTGRAPAESRARRIAAYLGNREAGLSIASMARFFGREESTMNRGVHLLEELMNQDQSLQARIGALAKRMRSANTGMHD